MNAEILAIIRTAGAITTLAIIKQLPKALRGEKDSRNSKVRACLRELQDLGLARAVAFRDSQIIFGA